MKRKSQLISLDLIVGFIIYIIALATFFSMLSDSPILFQDKKLDVQADFVFSNFENHLSKLYGEKSFFKNNKFVATGTEFTDFLSIDYADSTPGDVDPLNDQRSIVLGEMSTSYTIEQLDFCMFIVDRHGKILGDLGSSDIDIAPSIPCGSGSGRNSNPKCPTPPYTNAIIMSKPVLYYTGLNYYLARLKILICGDAHE